MDTLQTQYDKAWQEFSRMLRELGVNHPSTIAASKLVDSLHGELTKGQEPYNGHFK